MTIIQRIRQRFCQHEDNPDNRNHHVPFIGYEFQCPKCKAYVAYFKTNDSYMNISELQHNIVVEEGKKLYDIEFYKIKEYNNGRSTESQHD